MDTKTEELLRNNDKTTSRHSKPKKQHDFPDIDINFNSPRITSMIIIFLMMLTVGFLK